MDQITAYPRFMSRRAGFRLVRWQAYAMYLAWRRFYLARRGPWAMTRVACLGRDVLRELQWETRTINTQKGRVDSLLTWKAESRSRPRLHAILAHLERQDLAGVFAQQATFRWPATKPTVVIMDSFSELTDQLFVEREGGRSFCANYTDLKHDGGFEKQFACRGLLECDQLEMEYERFFATVRSEFGPIPIVFINFPKVLERRPVFRARHDAIAAAVSKLSARFAPLHVIDVDPRIVAWPDAVTDDHKFPYHYSAATCQSIVADIRKLKIGL